MASRRKKYLKFSEGFSIGDLRRSVAERDQYLPQYYVGHDKYFHDALQKECDVSVFVGPKGIGKSAILEMVRCHEAAAGNQARLIDIKPDDLAFNALTNITSRNPILDNPKDNQLLFKSLWAYVLCSEILKREHPGMDGRKSFLAKIFGPKHEEEQRKLVALSREDDGESLGMAARMLSLVEEISVSGSYGGVGASAKVKTRERDDEPANKPRVGDIKMMQLIHNVTKRLPDTLSHDYYILVDDLDLDWHGLSLQKAFVGSLFLALSQLSRGPKIKFVVSMRKEIFRQIELEEKDKFLDYVREVTWSFADVKDMVERRLSFFFDLKQEKIFDNLFPKDAFNVIWECTDGTPRDCIRAATSCVIHSLDGRKKAVDASDVLAGIVDFSEQRLDELSSKWMHTYPEIRIVIEFFKGGQSSFLNQELKRLRWKWRCLICLKQ